MRKEDPLLSNTIPSGSSYRDYLDEYKYSGITNNETSESGKVYNAVFTDEKDNGISIDDFLKIMVTQLTNQDFMNPVDDSQFLTQMAQFSTLQQMSDMTSNMKNNYMLSLVGQTVTCAKFSVSGSLVKETGPVERIVLADNDYSLYVNGEKFSLSQIMELGKKPAADTSTGTDAAGKDETAGKEDAEDKTEAAAPDKAENAEP